MTKNKQGAAARRLVPNPGSEEALALGCKCPVVDNCYGRFAPWPDGGFCGFWISELCKLHNPDAPKAPSSCESCATLRTQLAQAQELLEEATCSCAGYSCCDFAERKDRLLTALSHLSGGRDATESEGAARGSREEWPSVGQQCGEFYALRTGDITGYGCHRKHGHAGPHKDRACGAEWTDANTTPEDAPSGAASLRSSLSLATNALAELECWMRSLAGVKPEIWDKPNIARWALHHADRARAALAHLSGKEEASRPPPEEPDKVGAGAAAPGGESTARTPEPEK